MFLGRTVLEKNTMLTLTYKNSMLQDCPNKQLFTFKILQCYTFVNPLNV